MTFGENKDPVLGTPIDSQGLDIKAEKGTQVTCIAAGMIIYAGWFEGFGNVVILDHQNGWVSLYAHLDKITVIQGETIGAKTPIGTVGDTDTLVGSALKFQLRKNNKPLDPVPWLVPLN
jgi:septal ring factor EnvC (AmiA/AmiB activator)